MSKTWLITGSSRGLGRALVEAVLDAGDTVAATARDPGSLADLVQRYGDRIRATALDVTDPAAARRAVAEAVAAFGRLDVVVNNAGYANVNSIEDVAEDDFREQVETNLFGVVNVTRAALPVLHMQRAGHIIQISSIGGRLASAGLGAYQTSKWAVGGFSEVLAKEVQPLGINVTIVEPGGMKTDWAGASMRLDEVTPDYAATVGQMAQMRNAGEALGRGDPARVARAIIELASAPNPPLRLLIGSDAVVLAKAAAAARAREDAAWEELSNSTDFDGSVPFGETEFGKALQAQLG
jgi:NAD(P)-dependent dehydrogenase (short-subunit alcohol dehydrogenase family)